jgi:hypothetical protein
MTKNNIEKPDRRAAIICSHVANQSFPILRAVRDEPTVPEDSGWQFLCDSFEDEDADLAKVWLVCEVLEHEPSLVPLIDHPAGTVLTRNSSTSSWKLEN